MKRGGVQPELASPGLRGERARLWSDFSYVASSGYRERVLNALAPRPKLPKQLAADADLRMAHVSRALRELRERGLVECLTPELRARGRLYGITPRGSELVLYFESSRMRQVPASGLAATRGFVPKIRAQLAKRSIARLRALHGDEAVARALRNWSVNPVDLYEDSWLPVDAYNEFFEFIEAAFGDGSYDLIRALCREVVPKFSTVQQQILRAIPMRALAERAPIVYGETYNYGRLVVQTGPRWATFMHHDWSPSPAMCAGFHGTYEGILDARHIKGRITKTRCIRRGDDHCEYLMEW